MVLVSEQFLNLIKMDNKIRLIYIDEEESWQSTAYGRLKNDFDLYIPQELPKNIEELWIMVSEHSPQAILIDYRLNESGKVSYTGDEVIKEFHKHNKHLPMIIITSYEDDALLRCEEAQIIRDKNILTESEMYVKLNNIIIASVSNYNRRKALAEDVIRKCQTKLANGESLSLEESEKRFEGELYLSELDLDNSIRTDLITSKSNEKLDELIRVAKSIVDLHKK